MKGNSSQVTFILRSSTCTLSYYRIFFQISLFITENFFEITFILTNRFIQKANKIMDKSTFMGLSYLYKKKERTRISINEKNAFSGTSFMILHEKCPQDQNYIHRLFLVIAMYCQASKMNH